MTSPLLTLNSGARIPSQGYGVYKVPPQETARLVRQAIDAGYRLIDTAAFYLNEEGVGQAVRQAISDGVVSRNELFITSKLWNDQQGYDSALRGFKESHQRLGLDYLDLFLIHWPAPAQDKYLETYRAFEALAADGVVRSIGVSNFLIEHLERLLQECTVRPSLNQVELHPWLQQGPLRAFHAQHGILTQAWSPLARGQVLNDPGLLELSAELGLPVAQLVLCWLRELGISAIPKASSEARIRQNLELPTMQLSPQTMARIAALDRFQRVGSDPRTVG
ncbi:diketogulonate reductase-like aldo/keto reductase [Psychromicrobium silvestre]|uniref:Diketogulonate reductase-like aldo/keto reductase n=1 Tax=Psychromicrobium silvestre TaxID=1645614 RepID=A0A7Y9S4E2_9MICC|nr:aldo/keto reductase [Psychromicrobium silvestre]NYE94354.1 diketogulonate reductase-like aldo/keto reductase [Psychromicrobium silvestre]